MKKEKYIITSVVVLSLLLIFIDGFIKPPYLYKSILKFILFLVVPIIYFVGSKDNNIKTFLKIDLKKLKLPIILGLGLYVIIIAFYLLFKDMIDFEALVYSITNDISVNKDNFILVALYISTVNSFLEEFFFRGFAFLSLRKYKKFSYIFSSLMFSLYHAGTIGGFSPLIFLVSMIGLFIAGLIFDYLCDKTDDIYPSYALHMGANLGINTIGCIVFGII